MRPTTRLFAYLQPGTQTGLAGLYTHATPRSTLLFLYAKTLSRLSALPESSLYRQSVEAVTKYRLALVESFVPPGYTEWATRAQEIVTANAKDFHTVSGIIEGTSAHTVRFPDGKFFVVTKVRPKPDPRVQEWDSEVDDRRPALEGMRSVEERKDQLLMGKKMPAETLRAVELEPEPVLTAEQIAELENKIGAGLIEEVIQVAEGELKALDTLEQAKIWESLEEEPAPGQWSYFERHE